MLAVLELTGASIQDARTGRQGSEGFLEPCLPVEFVGNGVGPYRVTLVYALVNMNIPRL